MSDRDQSDKPDGAGDVGHPRAEEFVTMFRRGLKFTEELLEENERLRFRIASLEAQGHGADGGTGARSDNELVTSLRKQLALVEAERERLLTSFKAVEERNADYQSRYAEIEEEHNNLANLYIASYQLHSTLAFREVVQVVAEIVINLIGVQRFALMLLQPDGKTLHAVFAEGASPSDFDDATVGVGVIGKAVESGDAWVNDDQTGDPVAVVPLATRETKVGAIVIHQLLVQKDALTRVDHELFTLLGAHAATAMLSSLLRAHATEGQERSLLDPNGVQKALES